VQIAAPVPLDLSPAQIAISASGASAIGYAVEDADDPASSTAWVIQGRRGGGYGPPRPLNQAQQILALGFGPRGLGLLAGSSEPGLACCSQAQLLGPVTGSSFGPSRRLFAGLTGNTVARLIPLPGRLLAVAATERGVWAVQSSPGASRFGAAHRLSSSAQLPQTLDAIALGGGRSLVAWSARTGQITADGPRRIYTARGSAQSAPAGGRLLLTVPAGHEVDDLALAGGSHGPAIAWIESWYDPAGRLRSEVRAADLSSKLRPRTFSVAGQAASGLGFAGAGNAQSLAWETCNGSGDCAARAVLRRAKGGFGRVQRLGSIDATDAPATAVSAHGNAVVAWVENGHVLAAVTPGSRFSHPRTVSPTNFAADLALAASPRGRVLAVWTQGTLNESLHASTLR
jgi:hypothetical protein